MGSFRIAETRCDDESLDWEDEYIKPGENENEALADTFSVSSSSTGGSKGGKGSRAAT